MLRGKCLHDVVKVATRRASSRGAIPGPTTWKKKRVNGGVGEPRTVRARQRSTREMGEEGVTGLGEHEELARSDYAVDVPDAAVL